MCLVSYPLKAICLIAESSSNKIFDQRTFEFNMCYPGRASSIFKLFFVRHVKRNISRMITWGSTTVSNKYKIIDIINLL